MADVKISALPSATTPLAGTEQIPLVQSGATKKVTVDGLLTTANLGTPTAISLTNATNVPMAQATGTLAVSRGGTGVATLTGIVKASGTAAFAAATAGTDYVAPGGALGTPSSGTATNLTGLPLTTGVTGLLPVANGGTGTATPAIVAGTNVTVSGTWPNQTINATGGGGSGDVSGPASSTDNAVARFDSTTGKIIQNSGVIINDSGEVTVGVWKGTEVGLSYGGTGASTASQARGNILPSYTGNAGKVLAVNTGATDVEFIAAGGTGTVTSVAVSGGTTGLTTSGGPITAAGTITLAGTLAVASGGTGTATPSIVAGTNVTVSGTWPNQTINSTAGGSGTVTSVAATVPAFLSVTGSPITTSGTLAISYSGTALPLANGGTAATTAAGARTSILPSYTGNAGKVLAVNTGATDVEFIPAGGTGTVTSVGGTGTVNGISLSGTVTTSGNLTLGGTLDLSSPPAIGGTTPAAITGTTVTANTKFSGTNFDASGSGGGALRTSGGSNCLQWGGGGGVNLSLDGAFNMNPANATISIAPTGTGTLTVNPATAGTINNMAIGGTTPAAGAFTTLSTTTAIGPASGGTGVANNAAATVTSSGNFAYTRTLTGATNVTFPTTGTLATLAGTETFTNKTITGTKETVFAITDGAGFEINPANGGIQTITLGANRTPAATNFTAGQSVTLMIDDASSYAITWSTVNPTWVGATATGSAPTLATSGYTIIEFWKVGSTIYAAYVGVA
jgi:hypothetical protein